MIGISQIENHWQIASKKEYCIDQLNKAGLFVYA